MTPRFSVVSAYIKPFPAAPGQGKYKHSFNADEVPFILFLVLGNMLNVNWQYLGSPSLLSMPVRLFQYRDNSLESPGNHPHPT